MRIFFDILDVVIGGYACKVESKSSVNEELDDIRELMLDDDEKFFRSECEVENTCNDKHMEVSLMILCEFHRLFNRKYLESTGVFVFGITDGRNLHLC